VVPIGGRIGATAPAIEEELDELDEFEEQTRIAADLQFGPDGMPIDPAAAAAPAAHAAAAPHVAHGPSGEQPFLPDPFGPSGPSGQLGGPLPYQLERDERPRRQPWPVGAWIAVVGAASFGVALAVMVGIKMFQDPAPTPQATGPTEITPTPAPTKVDPTPIAAVTPTPTPTQEPQQEETPAPASGGGGGRTKRTGTGSTQTKQQNDGLSAEDRARLAALSEGLDEGPAKIRVSGPDDTVGPRRASLDESAIRTVVNRNRRQLQSCYELAIRGRSDPPTIRINVTVVIGASGTVTRATAAGNDLGGLVACIERNVRRWRFPASNETTETGFPVVFQPGASN
jgi:hypothetical protein